MKPNLSGIPYLARSAAFPVACVSLTCLVAAFPARGADRDWQLVAAAQRGDERMIRYLLDSGADASGQAGAAAVVEAVKNRQAKVLEVLLSRGASVEADDREYSRPRKAITLAAEAGSEESVAVLLRHGARPNTRNEFPYRINFHESSPSQKIDNHKSALMYAAEGGHTGVVRLLLKAGARPNATTVYDETALMFAAGKGHSETTRVLIQAGTDLNGRAGDDSFEVRGRSDYGGTALVYATRHAYNSMVGARAKGMATECREYLGPAYEIVAAYEERKQRVDGPAWALRFGLMCGDIPLLSRLVALRAVKRGSDVLLSVGGGFVDKDTPEAAELLIRAGADVNARMEKPWDGTPLMRAASAGAIRTATVLLDAGAEINATQTYGESALWHAARSKHADIVTLLLTRGADPNIVTKPSPQWFSKGGSALNVAVESGCMDCAKELLTRGANPEIPDESGRTPVEALRNAGLLPESGGERAAK
jgi:ankyrin repeat protein